MSQRPDSPQVKALLIKVEKLFNRPIKTPSDFIEVAVEIEKKTKEHISDSTIKRLYVPKLSYNTVATRTLNVLSKYIGFTHYEAFCTHLRLESSVESVVYSGGEGILAKVLNVGDRVRIAWLPDRECILKYCGNRKFEVESSVNSKITPQDTFFCSAIYRGRTLFVDSLTHNGQEYDSYGMGLDHGLTIVELL